jgi:D-sedoheptulose 7-phosphate isomerase
VTTPSSAVPSDVARRVQRTLDEVAVLHARLRDGDLGRVVAAAGATVAALSRGGRVLVFGNGGSAAEAQHFAADLVGRFERERQAMPAMALTTDTSALTAIANDYGFHRVFARQVEALGRPGDVAIGISTSGASANVVEGLRAARAGGLATIALTGGDGGPLGCEADIEIRVPHAVTARVQEAQLTLLHVLCDLIEGALAGELVLGDPALAGAGRRVES